MKNGLIINKYGDKFYYLNDQLHREDGPAIECYDGDKEWWLHDQPHREGGPAVEYTDGSKFWYLHGEFHREDGPAIEYSDGNKYWYLNGDLHRTDGPAVVDFLGGDNEWYYHGKKIDCSSQKEFKKIIKMFKM